MRGQATRQKLEQLRQKRLANDVAALLLAALGLAGLGLTVVGLCFWSGWVLLAFAVPLAWLGWRWLRGLSLESLGHQVEARFAETDGRLVAALELAGYRGGSKEGYSEELVEAAVQEVDRQVAQLELGVLVPRSRLAWTGLAALLGLGLVAGFIGLGGARAEYGLVNAFRPDRVRVEFLVQPGDTTVLPGSKVELCCEVKPAGLFRSVVLESRDRARRRLVVGLEQGRGRVVVEPGHGLRYRFRVLSRRSAEYRVGVLEPLRVERLVLTYRFPGYSGLAEQRSMSTDVVALRGTAIELEGAANRPIAEGRLAFGTDTLDLETGPEGGFRGRFEVRSDAGGRIELVDSAGGGFQPVEALSVRSLADEPPLVKLFLPGQDVDLPMSMQVLLGVNSLDDFGLGSLYLHYGKDSATERLRVKTLGGRREDTTFYTWDLAGSGLLPGDVMSYYVAVLDNDDVTGPKLGRTPVYQVRFPTMTEIYNASVRQTERTTQELAPLQETQERIDEELGRISEQLKEEGDLSWEERRVLEQLVADQAGLAQDIAELRQDIEDLVNELSEGMALDAETMEQLSQLHQLLSELLPRELQESLSQLRQALEQEAPDLRQALAEFELDQEQLRQGIEQALEFLERVLEEQRLEALARKAEDLAKAQDEVLERLAESKPEALARLEREIGTGIDSLAKELSDLAETMSDSATADSLSGLSDQMSQDRLGQLADQAAQSLQQGNESQAKSQGQQLSQKLESLAESLGMLSEGLKQRRSQEVAKELLAAAEDLLMVSAQQEGLEAEMATSPAPDERAAFQMSLHDATRMVAESLAVLAGKTMAVSGQIVQELARAMREMSAAAQAMVENQAVASADRMAGARTALNRSVDWLLAALERSQGSPGMMGGMESLLEQLSQMTGEQMAINAGMGGFPIPMPGGLTQAQIQALSRLLGKQRALRERLEQMLGAMGGERPGLTSSLDNLLEEMRQVEQDLAEFDIDRELIERQESILSHLLDAQRSVRQRGFKEQRESEAAKPFEPGASAGLPEDRGERNRMLREELMRALKQGQLGEYERQVRAYFEKLLNQP